MKNYMTDNQLIVITGPRGTGKTMLAGTYPETTKESMAKVFWHDSERSANRLIRSFDKAGMPLGHYFNIGSRFNDVGETDDLLARINRNEFPWVNNEHKSAMIDYYKSVLKDIDEHMTPGKYNVYVHDTLEKFEGGMAAFVDDNKKLSGVKTIAYGKLWSEGVYPLYEAFIEALFNRGIETIILTSHLKNPWIDNKPVVGKVAPSGKKLLYKLSSLFIWLVNDRTNADGAPAGLVLKERMGIVVPGENNQWKPKRMLPERIPHCTWADIDEYLEKGCDLANPATGEKMSQQELEMISELLTDEQMRLMVLAEQQKLEEMKNPQSAFQNTPAQPKTVVESISKPTSTDITAPQMAFIKLHHKQGMDEKQIAEQINLPLPKVKMFIKTL